MKNINLRERLRRLLNKEIGPLTTSQHLLRSTRARLENNKGVASKEYSIGALKSLTRGAFVGGVGGVIGSFGNIPAALAVSMVFGTLDLGQYGLRIINLAFWGKGVTLKDMQNILVSTTLKMIDEGRPYHHQFN